MTTATKTCYQKYTTEGDRSVAHKLLTAITTDGYYISVNDGEETVIVHSNNIQKIKDVMGTTGEDYIRVFDAEKNFMGSFWMIWDNGDDCPITDYSANELCEKFYNKAQ